MVAEREPFVRPERDNPKKNRIRGARFAEISLATRRRTRSRSRWPRSIVVSVFPATHGVERSQRRFKLAELADQDVRADRYSSFKTPSAPSKLIASNPISSAVVQQADCANLCVNSEMVTNNG
jgi:hypothetical protein